MIRRFKSVIPAALLLGALVPLVAQATDPLSYSYIEGQYLNTKLKPEFNGTAGKQDAYEGYRAAVNVSVYKFIYFTGEADKRRAMKYRFGTQSVGLGAHTDNRMSTHLQLFGAATYERTIFNDVTGFVPDDADEGYGVTAGVRVPFDNFEFTGSYRYMNYGETNKIKVSGDRFNGGILVQISPYFGLTGDYRRLDINSKGTGIDAKSQHDEWTVGFRTYFATDIDRYRRRGGFLGGD
jgi:hypothetical protein